MDRAERLARVEGGQVIQRADLSGVDLSGAALDGAIFEETSLRGAKLAGASLEESLPRHVAPARLVCVRSAPTTTVFLSAAPERSIGPHVRLAPSQTVVLPARVLRTGSRFRAFCPSASRFHAHSLVRPLATWPPR